MYKRVLIVGIVLMTMSLSVVETSQAAPSSQLEYFITYPTSGSTVGGVVEVLGSVSHPSAQWWYNVSYAPGAEPTASSSWTTLAQQENTPIQDDVIAVWDTTGLPNGAYTLAVTVQGDGDATPWQTIIRNINVNNTGVQPTATPQPEETEDQPVTTEVIGATPTPITIEQPSTATPRPGEGVDAADGDGTDGAEGEAALEEGSEIAAIFNMQQLREAFCTGGYITLLLFLLWGLYLLTKMLIRWYLRKGGTVPLISPPEE